MHCYAFTASHFIIFKNGANHAITALDYQRTHPCSILLKESPSPVLQALGDYGWLLEILASCPSGNYQSSSFGSPVELMSLQDGLFTIQLYNL